MKMLVIQHNDIEGPGLIGNWAKQKGYDLKIVRPDKGDNLKAIRPETLDFLVVLGSNESVNDVGCDWIEDERHLIQRVHAENKPIFGVCLGSQQIAMTMGSMVQKSEVPEIGWLPIEKSDQNPLDVPDKMKVFHWHSEEFTLPINAKRLFKSKIDLNQGYIVGNVAGVQFHFEVTPAEVKQLVKENHSFIDASDAPNACQQSGEQILKESFPAENEKVLDQILDHLVEK